MVKIKDIKPDTIYTKTVENYNINTEKLEHLFKAYSTEIPVIIGNNVYNPTDLQTFFKSILYNKKLNCFEFIIHLHEPLIIIRYYVNITECKNFINTDKVLFKLTKIEYCFSKDKEEYIIKIRKTYKEFNSLLKRFELLENIFNILNSDGSLEQLYKDRIKTK